MELHDEGWGPGGAASAIATACSDREPDVARILNGETEYDVVVDRDEAEDWLRENREELAEELGLLTYTTATYQIEITVEQRSDEPDDEIIDALYSAARDRLFGMGLDYRSETTGFVVNKQPQES
jgi:hypothetical protein